MSRHRADMILGLLVGAFLYLLAIRFLAAPLDRFDEGVAVTKAGLIASGAVPYRDFWITYGPLDPYLLAGLFKVFGADVLVERVAAIVVAGLFTLVAFRLMRSLGLARGMAMLITGLLALVPLSVPALNSSVLADLLGLAAMTACLRGARTGERRWPAIAGALTGLSSFTRPEFAAALGTGLAAGYLVQGIRQRNWVPLFLWVALALATAALLWTPVILLAGIQPAFFQLVIYAVKLYPAGRTIPLGQGPDGVMVIVFCFIYALVWLWAASRLARRRVPAGDLVVLVSLLISGILVFTWVRTRADGEHALDAWPLTAALLAFVMAGRIRRAPSALARLRAQRLDSVMAVVAVLAISAATGGLVARDLARPAGSAAPRATIVGARDWMPPGRLAGLIHQVRAEVPQDQPIFVGLQRNDQVVFNDTMLYFLSDRRPGTVYFEFFPGFTNSESTERTIACQLQRSGVRLAILGPNAAGEPWNNSSKVGSPFLDAWLAGHTVSRTEFAPYQLIRLQPLGETNCP